MKHAVSVIMDEDQKTIAVVVSPAEMPPELARSFLVRGIEAIDREIKIKNAELAVMYS